MASVYALKNDLRRYNVLKDDLRLLKSSFKKSLDALMDADQKLESYYSINNASADNGELSSMRSKLQSKYNTLVTSVIPEVEREIVRLKREIAEAEAAAQAE